MTAAECKSEHTPECASGRRAETRAACDCGATLPYHVELDSEYRLVVLIDRPLTGSEAVHFSFALQAAARMGRQKELAEIESARKRLARRSLA